MHAFPVRLTESPKPLPKDVSKSFGDAYGDHMFLMDYDRERGWHDARIEPFRNISLHPSAAVVQYAQTIFDGSKGYRRADGGIHLFRPQVHVERLNRSAARLCMPPVDPDLVLDAMLRLTRIDSRWVPSEPGTAIYVRQTMIGTEGLMVVRPSNTYTFMIFLSPVGSYYAQGAGPVRILATEARVRAAANGGIGTAKAGANYAASLLAGVEAHAGGFSQVLWLDSIHRRYLEEVGTMNIFVKIGGEVVTPPLGDSILPGVTRDSALTLMREWGLAPSERPIDIEEVMAAGRDGRLEEMWGVGTAAVVSPVGELTYRGESVAINGGRTGPLVQRLYDAVTALQYGKAPDPYGWRVDVPTE
ncbi:branched-chain amino acid aminotransferase [Aquibium oceanicum]|uniref:Branched-chain-amino-acid aminotransferase n=1 Tax=Aquibium oceanicum TaxID=1670800 RepID=A0A1L3SUW4_9HYPH|nr:branched-chain amino acid aminotransferase [Aquibium oceanicum]APH73141.1 branched chain amino acid aminotransferase [Aquibium oceanicum]